MLQITVRNGTAKTFTASNNFKVRLNTEKQSFPVLTGTEQWKPRQVVILYILTKKYYPLPQTYGGFQLDLGGRSSTLVPGPSAIFLRLKYNPATFANTLGIIVSGGQGNQGGLGSKFGIPNTSINEIAASIARRNDYGGHFELMPAGASYFQRPDPRLPTWPCVGPLCCLPSLRPGRWRSPAFARRQVLIARGLSSRFHISNNPADRD